LLNLQIDVIILPKLVLAHVYAQVICLYLIHACWARRL
jgi:hypothetical protein